MAEENKEPSSPTHVEETENNADSSEETSKMETDEVKEEQKEETKEESEGEEDKDADEEDDDDDDEEQVGLLEKPVVLEDGLKRERKKVERMTFQSPENVEKKFEVEKGSGTALGDMAYVEFKLNRSKAEDLKPLYRILFKKVGKVKDCKKHIRLFSGFPFSKSHDEFEKRLTLVKSKNYTNSMLKAMCEVLNVPRGGKRDELIDRLMDFLLKPVDSGKKAPESKKRKKGQDKKGATAKKAKRTTKSPKSATKSKKTVKKGKDEDDDEEDQSEHEVASEDEVSESEQESSAEDEPPKKKVKKAPTPKVAIKKKPAAKPKSPSKPKASPKKKATPAKKKPKVEEEDIVSDISSDDDSDNDEPLAQKIKSNGPPTNDELKDVIKKMLDSADLEMVTMKTVLKDVYAKYPSFDLSDRKEFIKNTVKQIIS